MKALIRLIAVTIIGVFCFSSLSIADGSISGVVGMPTRESNGASIEGALQLVRASDATVVENETRSGTNFAFSLAGGISGSVRAYDFAPLVGATVRILDSERDLVLALTTDSNGSYSTTTGLPDGEYYVEASFDGYYSQLFNNRTCRSTCEGRLAESVSITGASSRTGVDFNLTPTTDLPRLADLTATVLGAKRIDRRVSGTIRVRNNGGAKALNFGVQIFASHTAELTESAKRIKRARISSLGAGRSKKITFSAAVSRTHRWVFAVADSSDEVYELTEGDSGRRRIRD